MTDRTLTDDALAHLTRELVEGLADGTWTSGYVDVMTSVGYVALWHNGDVDAYGMTIATVGDDTA